MTKITFKEFTRFITSEGIINFLSNKLVLVCGIDPDDTKMHLRLINTITDEKVLISTENKTHIINIILDGKYSHEIIAFINRVIEYDINTNKWEKIFKLKIISN